MTAKLLDRVMLDYRHFVNEDCDCSICTDRRELIAEYDALKAQPSLGKSGEESGQKACAHVVEALKAVDVHVHADGEMRVVANVPNCGFWTIIAASKEAQMMFAEWKLMRDAALSAYESAGDMRVDPALPASSKSPSTASVAGWLPMDSAPRDGTRVRLMWPSGKEDVGAFSHGFICDEWSTDFGNGSADEIEPRYWKPLAAPDAVSHTTGQEKGNGN